MCRVGLVEFVNSEENIKQTNFLMFSNVRHNPTAVLLVTVVTLAVDVCTPVRPSFLVSV